MPRPPETTGEKVIMVTSTCPIPDDPPRFIRDAIRLENMVNAFEEAGFHIDVECHAECVDTNSHTLTNRCNVKRIRNITMFIPEPAPTFEKTIMDYN